MKRTSLARSDSGIPVQKVCRLQKPHVIHYARKEIETRCRDRQYVTVHRSHAWYAVTSRRDPRKIPEHAIIDDTYSTPAIISRVTVPLPVQSDTR